MSSRLLHVVVVLLGCAATVAMVRTTIDDGSTAAVAIGLLLGGPAWCYAMAVASDDTDFAGAGRDRSQWLNALPWTFLLAPLVLPNIVVLAAFVRDARLDGGRSPLTWDRMRPGDAGRDHHWPE